MANVVKLKRSAVPGKAPATTDLDLGELAINTYDGKVYLKKDNGAEAIVELGAGGSASASVTVSATAPASPGEGDLWWDSAIGQLFIYFTDADSSQWVAAAIGPEGPQGLQGESGEDELARTLALAAI